MVILITHSAMLIRKQTFSCDGALSFGFSGGYTNYRVALSTASSAVDFDPSLASDVNAFLPSAGFGVYYYSRNYYFGLSVPQLLENKLEQLSGEQGVNGAQQNRHYYAMGGYVFNLNRDIKMRPATMIRYTQNAPVSIDLGASLLFVDRVWVGAQYRSGGSIDAMFEFQATESIRIGYSYDQPLSAMAGASFGSHEIQIGIDLDRKGSKGAHGFGGSKRSNRKGDKMKRSAIKCYF
jgi:type IX secretion system PorP/SprF family membrane protein